MAPRPLRMRRFLGAAVGLALCACATPTVSSKPSGPAWLVDGMALGLPVEYPLQFGDEARETIRVRASEGGSERSRVQGLVRFLVDSDGLGFRYMSTRTLNAQAAFDAREGDCMSYAMLFVAAARSIGIEVHFVRITNLPVFWEAGGRFFTSSHIAVSHGLESWATGGIVVDFTATHTSEWRFSLYSPIDDETAFILFHSNKAVELLLHGQAAEAERLLSYLLERAPEVPEVYNNLGIALMHEHRMQEATELYGRAIERFPRFVPLYTNAVAAAAASGLPDLVKLWKAAGREVAQSDPAFSFAQGMLAFHDGDFTAAAEYFARALEVQPDDLTLLAWTARAHLSAGDLSHGRREVERIRQHPPSEEQRSLLGALKEEFPAAGIEVPTSHPAAQS
ncbi:MAG: tetratricopeptide repeat protein [Myxococcaceae bacterium]